jgi:hypothetical protein
LTDRRLPRKTIFRFDRISVTAVDDMNVANTSLVEELCKSPFAAGWPHGIVSEVVAIARDVRYPAGAIIFEQNAVNRDLFWFVQGWSDSTCVFLRKVTREF